MALCAGSDAPFRRHRSSETMPAGRWEGERCPSAIKATDLREQLLQGLAGTKHLGRMRLLWLAALGIAYLGLPAVASEEVQQCTYGQLQGQWEYGPMDADMTYTKQENGKYLQKSEWGDKILEKRKTDCETYIMTSVRDVNENNGKFCKFASLYSRTMSVSDSMKQSFIDFAMELQINREQTFFLAKKDAATKSD